MAQANTLRLIKFCRPEHRLPMVDRLPIGTLYAYRGFEENLPEGDEGLYDFELEVKGPHAVPGEDFAMLTGQRPLPAGVTVDLTSVKATPQPDGTQLVTEMKGRIRRRAANVFLFTMCIGERAMASPWKDYTSAWQIRAEAAERFAGTIAHELETQIRGAMQGPAPLASGKGPRPVIRYTAGPMIYGKRKMTFGAENPLTEDNLRRDLFRMPFIKPSQLAAEREFRFAFECLVGRRVYSPGKEGLFIGTAALAPFILQ